MRTLKRITFLLITLLTFIPMNASAQDDDQTSTADELITTSALSILVVAHTIKTTLPITGIVLSGAIITGGPITTVLSSEEQATLERYINTHHHQLEQDIALGAGSTLDDLAQLYTIPNEHYRDFSLAIRQHRRQLTIIDPQDPAQIEQFGLAVLSIKYQLAGVHITTQRRFHPQH